MAGTSLHERYGLDARFVGRASFVLVGLGLGLLLLHAVNLLLLVFGAVVVAVLLRTIADPLCRRTRLNGQASVLIALVFVLGLLGLASWLFGREVESQVASLSETLPEAWDRLRLRLESSPLGARLLDDLAQVGDTTSRAIALAPKAAMGVLTAASQVLLVVIGGAMVAMRPRAYRDGLLMLAPAALRNRLRPAFDASGHALKRWLLAQLVSMTVIGVLTGVGLWIVGVPSPLALGLLAGLAQFVPIVGPIVSSVPGLILAAPEGGQTLLLTLAVYVGVQQLESNLITPVVQRRMVSIPMALTLFSVVGFGMLLGPLGVLFATPLAVVLFVMVKSLWVRDWLGQETDVPGEEKAEAGE